MASSTLNQYMVRHRMLFRAGIVTLIIIVMLAAAVIPLIGSIRATAKKIETRAKVEATLVQKVSILTQLDQSVLAERLSVIDYALPPRKDVVTYLASVEGLSRELGLSFGGLSLNPGQVSVSGDEDTKKTKSTLQTLDTTIKIRGDQDAIYSFLRSVAQTLPLMQVKDVQLSNVGPGQYDMSLSLGMLWADPGALDANGAIEIFDEKEERYFQTLSTYRSFSSDIEAVTSLPIESGRTDLFAQ